MLAISTDNRDWVDVGRVEGARRAVDIHPFVKTGQIFRYVRLTNSGKDCGGITPGADIDAVAAVGSASRLTLDAAVLFDTGEAVLKAGAENALKALTQRIRSQGTDVRITIEGHTDDVGSQEDNQRLSEARARSVRTYLAKELNLPAPALTVVGYGESRPTAPNDSEDGRAKNRRVDILVIPGS
jgi:OmpA-OmpF porin, OOP family